MKKRKKIFSVILILITMIILSITIFYIMFKNKNTDESNVITAIKKKEIDGKNIEITYKIKIENYDLAIIEKTLKFETEEEAEIQYKKYEIINEYERKKMRISQNKKKTTAIMSKELFKEEINYKDADTFKYQDENGDINEIISQKELIETLVEQGYTIK